MLCMLDIYLCMHVHVYISILIVVIYYKKQTVNYST